MYSAAAPPPNDKCAQAEVITQETACSTTAGTLEGGTATTQPACNGIAEPNDDVWYSFVATTQYATVDVTASYNAVVEVLEGDCAGTLTSLGCGNGSPASFTALNLVVGNTYYVRVYSEGSSVLTDPSFDVCVYDAPAPPENSLCDDSIVVACGDVVTGNTENSTTTGNPTETCGTLPGAEGVWYQYVGTGEEVTVSLCDDITDYDTKLNIYTGDCTALVCEAGNDDFFGGNCTNNQSQVTFISTAGQTYYILVNGFGGNVGNFSLSVACIPAPTCDDGILNGEEIDIDCGGPDCEACPAPANDNLCDAISLTLNDPCTTATNIGATVETGEVEASCWGSSPDLDNTVWFSFEAPTSGNVLISTDYDGVTNTDTQLTLLELTGTDCTDLSALTELACDEDGGDVVNFNSIINASGLVAGGTYYLQVDGYNGLQGDFCISIDEFTCDDGILNGNEVAIDCGGSCEPCPAPENDDICNASILTVNDACTIGTNIGATVQADEPAGSCWGGLNGATIENSVWYLFQGPPSGNVTITTDYTGYTNTDTQIALYTLGDCNDLTTLTEVACDDDGGVDVIYNSIIIASGLTPGASYFIQVDGYLYTAGPTLGDFCISVESFSCSDGIQNGDEIDVDCGGLCDPCPAPLNDDICNAEPLSLNEACTTGSNLGSTTEVGEPIPDCYIGGAISHSVWYSFVAPITGEVTVSTDFATELTDTQIALFETSDCGDASSLIQVGCDDDGGVIQALNSILIATGLTPGNTYYIQVDAYVNQIGDFCIEVTYEVPPADCDLSITTLAQEEQTICGNEAPDLAAAEAAIEFNGESSGWTIDWYFDPVYLKQYTPGALVTGVNKCEPATIILYAQAVCDDGTTKLEGGKLEVMALPFPQAPAIVRNDLNCSYALVKGCPDDDVSPILPGDESPGYAGGTETYTVTTPEGCTATYEVIKPNCPNCDMTGTITFEEQGLNGGIGTYYYNTASIVVMGVAPYTWDWDQMGYVRHTLLGDGDEIDVIYSDEANWTVTITDSQGCQVTYTNDPNANADGNLSGLVDIVNYATSPDTGSGNGGLEIFVEGGDGNYSYVWAGSVPGGTYPNAGTLTNLESGWYTVTVTDGSGGGTVGWFWVEPGRRGRGKLQEGGLTAYPNPFGGATTIVFSVVETANTTVEVYSVNGQQVATLFKGALEANKTQSVEFKANDLPAGMYFIRLTTDTGTVKHHKVLLNR